MKKSKDQTEKPRRLTLNRETLQTLDQSGLLELAKGGYMGPTSLTVNEFSGNC